MGLPAVGFFKNSDRTRDNFGQPGKNAYRNPNVATVMKELGYVQRFGYGIQLAKNEMARNEDPAIEFQVEDSSIGTNMAFSSRFR